MKLYDFGIVPILFIFAIGSVIGYVNHDSVKKELSKPKVCKTKVIVPTPEKKCK